MGSKKSLQIDAGSIDSTASHGTVTTTGIVSLLSAPGHIIPSMSQLYFSAMKLLVKPSDSSTTHTSSSSPDEQSPASPSSSPSPSPASSSATDDLKRTNICGLSVPRNTDNELFTADTQSGFFNWSDIPLSKLLNSLGSSNDNKRKRENGQDDKNKAAKKPPKSPKLAQSPKQSPKKSPKRQKSNATPKKEKINSKSNGVKPTPTKKKGSKRS